MTTAHETLTPAPTKGTTSERLIAAALAMFFEPRHGSHHA